MFVAEKNHQNQSFQIYHLLFALLLTLNFVLAPKPIENGEKDDAETKTLDIFLDNDRIFDDDDDVYGRKGRPEFPFVSVIGGSGTYNWPPSFSLSRAHPLARICARGPCNVIFENILAVARGNYDTKSGYFFCHVPGLYFFTFSAISTAFSSFRLALIKNEQEIISAYGAANGFDSSGNSIVLPLQSGDKISLKLLEGELYESQSRFRSYTTFTGFLLSTGHGYKIPEQRPFEKPDREPFPGAEGIYPEAGPRNFPIVEHYNSSNRENISFETQRK